MGHAGPSSLTRDGTRAPALGPWTQPLATREVLPSFFSQVCLFHWLSLFKGLTFSLQTYSFAFASHFILSQAWFYLYFQAFSRVVLFPYQCLLSPPPNIFI